MKKPVTKPEQYRSEAQAAMPDVKKLLKTHSRRAINSCLKKLHEYEKQLQRLNTLQSQVNRLRDDSLNL